MGFTGENPKDQIGLQKDENPKGDAIDKVDAADDDGEQSEINQTLVRVIMYSSENFKVNKVACLVFVDQNILVVANIVK